MANEAVVDPLQLVPHRIKVFKLLYDSYRDPDATEADVHSRGHVSTRRRQLDELKTRYGDDSTAAKHSDELQ